MQHLRYRDRKPVALFPSEGGIGTSTLPNPGVGPWIRSLDPTSLFLDGWCGQNSNSAEHLQPRPEREPVRCHTIQEALCLFPN